MKLSQLKYFLEVASCLNITKAAKNLFISQPTLTVSIKNLEKELGIKLFYRSKQRITLTQEGEVFREKLKPIFTDLVELREEMISLGVKENNVRIGMPPMMGALMFPKIFSKFINDNPEIQFTIKENGAIKVLSLLMEDELDLSLLILQSHSNQSLEFHPLEEKDLKLYVNKKDPLAEKDLVSIKELKDLKLILFDDDYFTTKVVKDKFKSFNMKPNIALQTTQINTINHFITQNLGASILIEGSIAESEHVKSITIEDTEPVTIGIAWKKEHFLSTTTKKLLHYIRNKEYEAQK